MTLSAFAAANTFRNSDDLDDVQSEGAEDERQQLTIYDSDQSDGEVLEENPSRPQDDSRDAYDLPDPLQTYLENTLSTWYNRVDVIEDPDGAMQIHIRYGETLTLVGTYRLQVLEGAVTVYGAILTSQPRQTWHIFAPTTHALPTITGLNHVSTITVTESMPAVRELGSLSPLFRRLWSLKQHPNQDLDLIPALLNKASFHMVRTSRQVHSVVSPPQWQEVIHDRLQPVAQHVKQIMVIGQSNCGKSTFCRLLVNHLLTRQVPPPPGSRHWQAGRRTNICWLDLDCGQSEFSPAGQITLVHMQDPILGPPFTHACTERFTNNRLVHAHYIGSSSPFGDPKRYLDCAKDLQARYLKVLEENPNCPLVINCPGWSKEGTGFGVEVVVQLLSRLHRTDTVLIGRKPHGSAFQTATQHDRIYEVDAYPSEQYTTSRTASQYREMQMQSYLHSKVFAGGPQGWNIDLIDERRPWTIRYQGPNSDLLGIVMQMGLNSVEAAIVGCLDRWIVGICVIEDDEEVVQAAHSTSWTDTENLPYFNSGDDAAVAWPAIEHTRLLGWACFSKIDTQLGTIELKPPLSAYARNEALTKTADGLPRLILVRGRTDNQDWIFQERQFRLGAQRRKAAGVRREAGDPESTTCDSSVGEINLEDLNGEPNSRGANDDDVDYVSKMKRGRTTQPGHQAWRMRPRITGETARRRTTNG